MKLIKQKPVIMFFGLILALGLMRCGTMKTNNNNPMETPETPRALLLDGEWTLNYVMNAPGSFETLYPKAPVLRVDSRDGKVSGFSGCNQFTGILEVDGNKLKWAENFATTRKMCPNMEAEEFFLSSLKKANTYSVSNKGNTLNLIMGDIAFMRFERQ